MLSTDVVEWQLQNKVLLRNTEKNILSVYSYEASYDGRVMVFLFHGHLRYVYVAC